MDKKDLQKKLNKPYSTENWREVVQFVFPNVQILNPPMVIPIDNDKVESFRQLGNVQLHDGKSLALFELKLKANVNIIRNRVELNNIVSQYIDQDQTHGVLSIFEQGGDDYRFTFSARASEFDEEEGEFITKKTDTKRFTYVLGKNESCKTPAQRFYELSENKNKAEIKDIENAFSVEKLSKAFFKEYKDQYTAFVNYMMQTPGIFKAIYSEDDKAIRDFVKILLGRIIFIKFVQKKGWMGVDASSKKWLDGDYSFLEKGFADFEYKDLFYSTFLEPLFDALDEPNRPNDIFTVTNTRVPYLSGGLFELEDKKTKNINFPAKYFNDLFEFLDRYNFTIDENDTNDHEVGIDPEMLGHIFENLLEDNKDKGAFYTPKEIVRYMCQESLKEYLKTSLENNKQWPSDAAEATDFEQALHNFVTKKEAGGIIEFEETIARALKDVKICDPAIGSGAFPMGLLNEIFQLVHKLHEANKDKVERVWELKGWQPNLVKQNIIQNSIYGVDIEKGAVDVARLRFWLSLIVDEPEPKALPHLDYKIVVGNSLVSKLDDTIIDIDWEVQNDTNLPETDLFGKPKPKQFNAFEVENDEKQKQLLKEISAKQKLVFDPNSDEEKLSLQIRNLKIDLLINQLDAMVKTKGVTVKPTGTSKTIKAQTELWLQTLGWKQQIEKLQKLKKDTNGILHFFDWKLDFPEIMNEQVTDKVGFDIVIANPPYLGEKGNKDKFREIKEGFLKDYYQSKMDIFYFFFHLGIVFSKENGIITFITTNYFPTSDGALKLRTEMKKKVDIIQLINFNEFKLFDSALGQHNLITILRKSKRNINSKIINVNRKNQTGSTILNKILNCLDNETDYKTTKNVYENDNNYIRINNSNDKNGSNNIFDKIQAESTALVNLANINSGCDITLGKVTKKHLDNFPKIKSEKDSGIFVLNKKEKDNLYSKLNIYEKTLIKTYIKNSDIKNYTYKVSLDYLIYTKWDTDSKKIPNIINHLSKFKSIIDDQILRYEEPTWPWYAIHRPREQQIFESEIKILVPYRSKINYFAISTEPIYSSRDVFYITNKESVSVDLYAIATILNSKLIYYWLFNKGKRKGDTLELYNTPLSEIPIKNNHSDYSNKLNILSKKIIEKKHHNQDTKDLEQQIDNLVYKLYELTYDEVLVVEPEFSERMSREAYEVLKVE
jgi:adenine-specific DNA-methyltransferase